MGETKKLKDKLEECGCTFTKRFHHKDTSYWECTLDGMLIASHKYLGDCVQLSAQALGE